MAVTLFRQDYADEWLEYIRTVAVRIDQGRARLVVLNAGLAHERSASSVLLAAEAAVTDVLGVLDRRLADIAASHLGSGCPIPYGLLDDYLLACGAVQQVCTTLELAVRVLLRDDSNLPQPTGRQNSYLSVLRPYLVRAETLLGTRTTRLLTQAGSVLVLGHLSVVPSISATQVSDGNYSVGMH